MSSSSMKRHREDSSFGPHLKRPSSASGESSEPVQTAAGSQGVTTDDALQYLKAVKDRFKDDKDKYDCFLEVMKHFKAQRIDTAGVIARVKDLFRGHPGLIIGFNTFLPKGYEITLPLEEETPPPPKKQPVEFDQAINYVNKIKTRFEHDEQVYKAFLEILNMYRKGNKSISEVYQEVAHLFQLHSDLLEEFTDFLPDSTGPVNICGPVSSKPLSSVRRDDKGTVMSARHSQSDRVVKREKIGAPHIDRDRGFERPEEQEIDRSVLKIEKEQRRKIEKEREKRDQREQKEVIKGEKESELENDLDAMHRPRKRKSARRADELIRKQSQVGEGGETFAGPSAPAALSEDIAFVRSTNIQSELLLFDSIKSKLQNSGSYQELLKCLDLYSQEIISRMELQSLVEDILLPHRELLEGFMEFLVYCESVDGYLADIFGRRVIESGDGAAAIDMDKEREKERNRDRGRERDRDRERQMERVREREKEKDREKEKERDKERERDRVAPHHLKDGANNKISLLPPKERLMNKPISELDLSNCERCTPSYRLLPNNYPKPLSSHRTEMGFTVLNDNWVSVTSGSEDYSFKHMRKNQYEESLFCCEDDRFELDMLLESIAITGKRVGEMVENILVLTVPQCQFSLDEHLSAINLRCIERLYGDHGLDIVDLLRKNPGVALPVVHARLMQKHEEWLKGRMDMNKVWAEVYSKNYHKSLDHRSFYFKQQDKRSLSTKGLLTEIKEINEKKRREDNTMLLIAVCNRRPLIPDLKFEYPDPSIHEDLYQIVKYSADEVCNTMEQYDKIMRIWTTFIEPMFGVPPRPHGAEDTEEAAKVKAPESKQSSSSAGECATTGGADGTDKTANQLADGVEPRNTASAAVDEFATATSRVKGDRIDTPTTSLADGAAAITATPASNLREDEGEQGQRASKGNLQTDSLKSSVPIASHHEKADLRKQPSHFERLSDMRIKQSLGTDTASSRPSSDCIDRNEKHGKPVEAVHLGRSSGIQTIFTHRRASDAEHEAKLGDQSLALGDAGRKSRGREDEEKLLGYTEEAMTFDCNTFNEQSGRTEREEGELSPSPEAEERENTGICSDKLNAGVTNYPVGQVMKDCKSNKDSGIRHEDDGELDADGDGGGDHDADADDEGEDSAQKSTEDSENISEAGDEVSGSASGDNDDASHEDHEEEDDEDEEQEGKVESEGEAEGMADAEDGEGDGFSMASLDRSLAYCKPLAAHATSLDVGTPLKDGVIFYGNDIFYILFRLHQTLYERVLSAKTNAMAADTKWKSVKDASSPDPYSKFLRCLYNLLDGSADNAKFEDECRAIIGTQSYILFTLDKLIFKLVKQLQAVAADDMANKLLLLHAHEKSRGAGGVIDIVYHANACVLHDESIFRFERKACPSELLIQLMDGGPEKLEVPATAIDYPFQTYLNDYLLLVPERKDHQRVFAKRNKRKFSDDNSCESFVKAMRNVHVVNGLECKIACSTSKVSYVLDTEDLLYRRKRGISLQANNGPHTKCMADGSRVSISHRDRVERFRTWLQNKLTEER